MTSTSSKSTPAQRLIFLQKIQRLFEEANFTATYKFALLMALSDLAVEEGEESDSDLVLPMRRIAEKFIQYYLPQSAPYASGRPETYPQVLSQNLGAQAAIVKRLTLLREAGVRTIRDARAQADWHKHVGEVAKVVRNMPVKFLQNIGSELDPFLYEPPIGPNPLVLQVDVVDNLRYFHTIIHRLAKGAWLDHVRNNQRNLSAIGQSDDLEGFLFGSSRRDLSKVADILVDHQAGRCFYCGRPLRGRGDVDHFVAWSRYPRDMAHNFVLSHTRCNGQKSDLLAAREHLEHWLERNSSSGNSVFQDIENLGFPASLATSEKVAQWAYEQGVAVSAHGWIAEKRVEVVDRHYLDCFH